MTAAVGAISAHQRHYRADIDGLRALSILLVVAFHAGWARFAGGYVGVDVFFVLSGYLITGLLVREHERDGRVSLRDFYARRIRRLLPLSALVLTVTAGAGALLLPPLRRAELMLDVQASALYVANWRYGAQATAYMDAAVTDSLLLHYWSLAVEEQFYVLWPLIVIAVSAWVGRRGGAELRRPLTIALTVLVVASFTASVVLTPRLGPQAYYATHTRLWEMGVGALVALVLPQLPAVGRRVGEVLGLAGVAAIVLTAMLYGPATAFPGWAAAVPVLGTVLVVVAAHGTATRVSAALSSAPLVTLGRWSYAWYLWHWPAIGIALLWADRVGSELPTAAVTAMAAVGSLALAAASHRLVENPVRFSTVLRDRLAPNFVLGATLSVVPVLFALAYLGWGAVGDDAPVAGTTTAAMTPAEAAEDGVAVGAECFGSHLVDDPQLDLEACAFGDLDAERTVVVMGDSHALHWVPALEEAATREGWRLLVAVRSSCAPVDVELWQRTLGRVDEGCARWREQVLAQLDDRPVAAVVLARSPRYSAYVLRDGVRVPAAQAADAWRAGAERTFAQLEPVADRVVVLEHTPWADHDVPTCLSEPGVHPTDCAVPMVAARGADADLRAAERQAARPEVAFLEVGDLVCAVDPCDMVTAEGIIKYRDAHHLTATYSRSLGPALGDRMADLLAGEPPATQAARPARARP